MTQTQDDADTLLALLHAAVPALSEILADRPKPGAKSAAAAALRTLLASAEEIRRRREGAKPVRFVGSEGPQGGLRAPLAEALHRKAAEIRWTGRDLLAGYQDLADAALAFLGTADSAFRDPAGDEAARILKELRAAGWAVAVHNDYRIGGEFRTFWLLTHPNRSWAKGEGRTDAEALCEAARQTREPAGE